MINQIAENNVLEFKIPTMLTIKETAEVTKMAEHHVRQLAISGKIVCVKTGKKYLINLEKFIDYLNTSLGDTVFNTNQKSDNKYGIKTVNS